jgi:tetratricopeptide (TPR) repeat protein
MMKCLESNDESSTSEMYWIHAEPFGTAGQYVRDVSKSFIAKYEAMQAAMKAKKMPPWPPLPDSLRDEAFDPVERLRELATFGRTLLPASEGFICVWAFCPTQISDTVSHAALFSALMRHANPFPWFHHLRFFLREDLTAQLSGFLQRDQTSRVAHYCPDLSPAAIDKSLEDEASSPGLPLHERIQAIFLSAQLDFTERRFDEALKKQALVLKYHTKIENAPMVAMAFHSVGEIHQRMGHEEQAARCFETAFSCATIGEHPQLPILLNTLLSLANLRLGQSRLAEAEAYYDNAEKLATVLRNPFTKLQSIENLGYCQYTQGKYEEAVTNWHRGAEIACKLEHAEIEQNMLLRLRSHYMAMNNAREVQAIDTRLAEAHGQLAGR